MTTTGRVIGAVAAGNVEDVDLAVCSAREAFDDRRWRGMTPARRARILWRVADLLEANVDEIAHLEMLDTGKPLASALHG